MNTREVRAGQPVLDDFSIPEPSVESDSESLENFFSKFVIFLITIFLTILTLAIVLAMFIG